MGVKGLEYHMKFNVKDGVKIVNVLDEIKVFQSKRKQNPVLVFDVMSLVNLLCAPTEEILCGGRHQKMTDALNDLFSTLTISGAELVFFQDGQIANTKFATWRKRQNEKYKQSLRLMDMIDDGWPLNKIAKNGLIHAKIMMTAIEESCKKFGKLRYAMTAECDQELARFAYKNSRVMAVLSNDTDFLIFPGTWRYFSTMDLDPAMQTKEFNRVALHASLKLNTQRLALLATIAGNDFVPVDDLRRFHESIGCKANTKFKVLSKFIAKNFKDRNNQEETLGALVQIIFNETGKNLHDLLKISIEFYKVDETKSEPQHPLSFHLDQHNLFIYQVLNQSPINLSLVFYDCRQSDMPSFYDLTTPLVQRQAGVLLMHSQCDFPYLKIYSKKNHASDYESFMVLPTWPPFSIPTLEKILSDDPEVEESRFQLLKWTVAWEILKGFDLRDIPSRYMIDVLTLLFLLQRGVITLKEADLILWTVKSAEEKTIVRNIRPPRVLDPRAFRVAFLFVKTFANVARSIEVCGLKKKYWKPCNFDGVFFHLQYNAYKNRSFDFAKHLIDL